MSTEDSLRSPENCYFVNICIASCPIKLVTLTTSKGVYGKTHYHISRLLGNFKLPNEAFYLEFSRGFSFRRLLDYFSLMQNLMKMAKSKIQRGNVTKSTTAEIDIIAEPYNFYNFRVSPTMDEINELEKEFEKLSSGIEALQLLLQVEYNSIPSLSTITESATHNENVTTQLMKQGKYKEALEFCQKCDLDAKRVYKEWGMSALKAGSVEDARSLFKKCLDNVSHKRGLFLISGPLAYWGRNCAPRTIPLTKF